LFFIHLASRRVHVAGVTPHPDERWMVQTARNVTMADWGFLSPGQYLIHDRDGKYCPAFQQIIENAGVTRVPLPPRSPNLHADAERLRRSLDDPVWIARKVVDDADLNIHDEHGTCVPIQRDGLSHDGT